MINTAQYRYSGPNRMDITVKGQDPLGRFFAPTWDMVIGYKNGSITQLEYTVKYIELMRQSYRDHKDKWDELLSKDRVLVCFCKSGEFCHRLILANLLVKLGAEYCGENN